MSRSGRCGPFKCRVNPRRSRLGLLDAELRLDAAAAVDSKATQSITTTPDSRPIGRHDCRVWLVRGRQAVSRSFGVCTATVVRCCCCMTSNRFKFEFESCRDGILPIQPFFCRALVKWIGGIQSMPRLHGRDSPLCADDDYAK